MIGSCCSWPDASASVVDFAPAAGDLTRSPHTMRIPGPWASGQKLCG